MHLGNFDLSDTVHLKFTTVSTTGAPTQLAGTPVVSVYKTNSTTQTTTGVTLTVDFDTVTGLNHVAIDTSADGTFYAASCDFQVVITTGTVGGTSVVGYVVASFSIRNRAELCPTTADRTLDVSAGGEAGLDWANVGSQSTSVNLSATTINLVNTATTVTNQLTAAQVATGVWQDTTAGDFTVASSIGKSLYTSGVVPGGSGGLLISGSNSGTTTLGALTVSGATTLAALSCTTLTASGAVAFQSTFAVTTSTSLGALSCTTLTASGAVAFQSTFAVTTSTSLAALSATTITASGTTSLAAVTTSGTVTFNAFTVTGALTAGTNAVPWNASWDAEVQSEVDDALVVHRLDELLNADSDIDGAAPPTVGSVFHELMTKTAGSFTYDQTTDSLEALRDRGDAAWITATGFSTHSAADVWTNGTRTLTSLSGLTVDTVTTLTNLPAITSNWLTATGLAADAANEIADAVLSRSASNVEASAPEHSLCSIILGGLESSVSGGVWTIKRTDGSTTYLTKTVTTNASADPITGVS